MTVRYKMRGAGPRADGCTCGEMVSEHVAGCPVVPFRDPREKIRGPLAGTSGPADGTAGAVPPKVPR